MGTRIYVGRIPYRASERDVEYFFRGYGRIVEVILKNGYGFVEFADYRDADDAVHDLNGRDLLGDRVYVEFARGTPRGRDREEDMGGGGRGGGRRPNFGGPRSPRFGGGFGGGRRRDRNERTEYRLVVENLSSRVSWQDLKDYMRQAGEVTYADAHGKRKNEGLVEFATKSDMKTALEKLEGKELCGRKIHLVEEKKRKEESRSRSRSGSKEKKSKSRTRSRTRSKSAEKKEEKKEENGIHKDEEEEKKEVEEIEKEKERSPSRSASKSASPEPTRKRSRSPSAEEDEKRARYSEEREGPKEEEVEEEREKSGEED